MPPSPARAGGSCDLNDIWNALQNTLNTISSANCAGVTADPALWAPVGVAAGVMAGVSQSQQFCQDVQNAQNQLTNLQGDGNSLVTQLGNLGIDASFLSSILDAMSSAADALAIVQCACGLSNNITQVGGDLGACVEDALCDLQNWRTSSIRGCSARAAARSTMFRPIARRIRATPRLALAIPIWPATPSSAVQRATTPRRRRSR